MLFNSLQFLLFFPAVTAVYFLLPHRVRYLWLLGTSYYFYMCWNPKYALLMGTSTLITFVSGLLIDRSNRLEDKARGTRQKKLWVALSFTSNLAILYFFKYFDFSVANINAVLGLFNVAQLRPGFDVLLPVGISFYTFHALSYTMDVYRGEMRAEHNVAKYALFVSYFPQMVAGPIARSKQLLVQMSDRHTFEWPRVRDGLLLMLWGYFLKLVIADRVALLVNQVYNDYTAYSGASLVVATVFFAIQIYCDFASYSLLAIGSAQVMGFRLVENFNTPYFARSIGEFWRRWHMSLSTWFRDYLYIPLGGNRKGRWRKYFNVMLVFLVSGFWHGAAWTYIIWGGLNGGYQVVGEITKPLRDRLLAFLRVNRESLGHKLLQTLISFVLICVAWVFFRANSLHDAVGIFRRIATQFQPWTLFDGTLLRLGLDLPDFMVVVFSVMVLTAVSICKYNNIRLRALYTQQDLWFRWTAVLAAIFLILIFGVYGPGYSAAAFIYFQF